MGEKQRGDLIVANADGSNPITIDRDLQDMSPATWSADDRWLVYSLIEGGRDQIYIAAADGSSPPTRLGKPDTIDWAPVFSPDGTKIMYFVTKRRAVMNLDGSDDRLLNTSGFQRIHSAQWHPDGNRIVVSAAVTERKRPLVPVRSTGRPNDTWPSLGAPRSDPAGHPTAAASST